MKLNEVKTYVLGVLRGAFKNKDIIDKLSVNERKDLTYDGLPVNGKHNCYRQEEILWEGQIYKTNETAVLSKSIFDYDELIFCCRMQRSDMQWFNLSVFPKDLTFNLHNDIMLAGYSTCWQDGTFTDEYTYKVTGYNTGNQLQVYLKKIIGIKHTAIPDTIKAVEYYDTEEQVVGRWVDGRPVYRKVFIATKTTTGETSYPIKTVLGLNSIKDFHLIRENIAQFDAPNNFSGSGYFFAANTDYLGCYWNVSNNDLIVRGGSNWPKVPFTFCYVAEYTKTADAVDSFSPDLIHNPLTRYSTEETKIGEWVDGKPIYRKMFELPNSVTLESAKWYKTNISITDLNIEHLINGKLLRTSTSTYDAFGSIDFDISTGYIRLLRGTGITLGSSLIFIEYTKTTD